MPKRNNKIPKSASRFQSKIPKPDLSNVLEGQVCFSFKYLDLSSNPKFSIDKWPDTNDWSDEKASSYLNALLDRLKSVSGMHLKDFLNNRSHAIRSHPIDWNKTSETDGFMCLNQTFRELEARQFSMSSNEHGRAHGFMLDNCFCVVWLDPFHQLYP